jgi:ribonuclease E
MQEARRRAEPVHEEPAPMAAPAPQPVAQPAPRPAPQPQVPSFDSKELLDTTGLQMVETDRSKSRPAAPEPEPQPQGRPRRERPAPQAEEPLVQIETRK